MRGYLNHFLGNLDIVNSQEVYASYILLRTQEQIIGNIEDLFDIVYLNKIWFFMTVTPCHRFLLLAYLFLYHCSFFNMSSNLLRMFTDYLHHWLDIAANSNVICQKCFALLVSKCPSIRYPIHCDFAACFNFLKMNQALDGVDLICHHFKLMEPLSIFGRFVSFWRSQAYHFCLSMDLS